MKIVENNVKYGEIFIFDHRFYKTTKFPSNFVPEGAFCQKYFVPGVGFLNEKVSGSGVSRGGGGGGGWLLVKVTPALLPYFNISSG